MIPQKRGGVHKTYKNYHAMNRRLRLQIMILTGLLATGFYGHCIAQETSTEVWPEVDVWYKVSPSWRFSAFIPFSQNLETNYREGSFLIQGDYSWGKPRRIIFMRLLDAQAAEQLKNMMFRFGYSLGKSLDDDGEAYSEKTAILEQHLRIPTKGNFLVTHRFRADLRWLGADYDFSQRYRYRIMIEKEYKAKKVSFVPYSNAEAYYDSRYNTVNRFRLIAGSSVSWSQRYAFEANYTYQHDTRSSVTNLHALNLIAHFYFQSKSTLK